MPFFLSFCQICEHLPNSIMKLAMHPGHLFLLSCKLLHDENCNSPLGTCTFEETICGWIPDDQYQLTWNRQAGTTYTYGFGPDHTNGGTKPGWFMAMDMWKGDDLEARMVTRKFSKSGVSCTLDFWYWMAFSSGGRLAVEIEVDGKQPVVRFACSARLSTPL